MTAVVGATASAVITSDRVEGLFGGKGADAAEVEAVKPDGRNCPLDARVKGNIADSGERIFHEPGWRYYSATWPDACFATSGDAESAGYRASMVR